MTPKWHPILVTPKHEPVHWETTRDEPRLIDHVEWTCYCGETGRTLVDWHIHISQEALGIPAEGDH